MAQVLNEVYIYVQNTYECWFNALKLFSVSKYYEISKKHE